MKGPRPSYVIGVVLSVLVISAVIIVPGVVRGQITPDLDGVVSYPPGMTDDVDKLHACYAILEQLRDERNRQAEIARSDPARYIDSGKWYAYAENPDHRGGNIFAPIYEPVLNEASDLRERIRSATYTEAEWDALSLDDKLEANLIMFGNKTTIKDLPTLATYDGLVALWSVDLDSIEGVERQGTEDLTTYYKCDGLPGYLTVASSKVDINDVSNVVDDCYLVDDKGAGHFAGDFEHLVDARIAKTGGSSSPFIGLITLSDEGGESCGGYQYYDYFETPVRDCNVIRYRTNGSTWTITYLIEIENGSTYVDAYTGSYDTRYWHKFKRTEGGTSYLYDYIYDAAGYGAGDLVDTLTLTLHANEDWRYIFTAHNPGASSNDGEITGDISNLDLQEEGAEAVGYSFGYIIGGGP